MVDDAVAERVEFLMTKLEPVKLKGLDPDNRLCSICQEELVASEDGKPSHVPVRTICGHIFGKKCAIRWFDPFKVWAMYECESDCDHDSVLTNDRGNDSEELESESESEGELVFEYNSDEVEDEINAAMSEPLRSDELEDAINAAMSEPARSACPMCRRVFFPRCIVEPMEMVSLMISLWDMAYASAGVARSEYEESSRAYLLQYIEYCWSTDDNTLDFKLGWYPSLVDSQRLLVEYTRVLKTQKLTPGQEILRNELERIGGMELKKCTFKNGYYDFNIESADNERHEFKNRTAP